MSTLRANKNPTTCKVSAHLCSQELASARAGQRTPNTHAFRMSYGSEAPSKSLVAKHAALIQSMDWRQLLQHHKLAFAHESAQERAAIASVHGDRLVRLGALGGASAAPVVRSPEIGKIPQATASALKAIVDARNSATSTIVSDAVSRVKSASGLTSGAKALLDQARLKQEADQNAATDKTYADAEVPIASLPPDAQMAAANVFIGSVGFALQAASEVQEALTKAFSEVANSVNAAISAVEGVADQATGLVDGAAHSVAGFFGF